MKHWRWLAIGLLVVLVLGGGGVLVGMRVTHSRRLNQQQASYAAGHAASLRADCPAALRDLMAAEVTGLSEAVATRAKAEQAPCLALQSVQRTAAGLKPAAAVGSYLIYLNQKPGPAFAAVARTSARSLLTSAPLHTLLTPQLCRENLDLAGFGILKISQTDPLAAPFLATCAKFVAEDMPGMAFDQYYRLQTDFPTTKEAHSTVAALGDVVLRGPVTLP